MNELQVGNAPAAITWRSNAIRKLPIRGIKDVVRTPSLFDVQWRTRTAGRRPEVIELQTESRRIG